MATMSLITGGRVVEWNELQTPSRNRIVATRARLGHEVCAPWKFTPARARLPRGMPSYFRDRYDAGRQLAALLDAYAGRPDVVVLALPRGGVPVGYEVA